MALSGPVPPWLNIGPNTFLNAMEGGGKLGVLARAQDVKQEQAADRLQLAYEQLGSKEDMASQALQGKLQLGAMQLDAKQRDFDIRNAATGQSLAERQAHNLALEGLGKERLKLQYETAKQKLAAGGRAASVSPMAKMVQDYQAAVEKGDEFAAATLYATISETIQSKDPTLRPQINEALKEMHTQSLIAASPTADPGARRLARQKARQAQQLLEGLTVPKLPPPLDIKFKNQGGAGDQETGDEMLPLYPDPKNPYNEKDPSGD